MDLNFLSSVKVEHYSKPSTVKEVQHRKNNNDDNNNNDEDKEKDRIEGRRSKVQELSSKGNSQKEIAQIQLSNGTINRDLSVLRHQANIKKYIDERLPEQYEKCLVGLIAILREAWTTSQQTEDKREKMQALSLAKECYSMKLDLLTNATVVDDAIRFVSQKDQREDKINYQ
jgi:hypothetical protein